MPLFVKYYGEGYEPDEMLRGIIEVKGPDAVEALSYAYRNGSEDRRLLAIRSLSGRGPGVAKVALEAMEDRSQSVRSEALVLAKDLTPRQRVDMAAKGLKDTVVSIRLQAIDVLAGVEEGLSAGYVVQSLNDPVLTVKAFSLLSRMSPHLVVKALSEAVQGIKEPDVRMKAVALLDEKGAGSSIFIKMLDDPEREVRRMAVDSLIKRGDPDAIYGLIIAGTGPDETIARLASGAFGKIKADNLREGVDLLFEKGMASRERILFVVAVFADPETLKDLVVRIKDEPTLEAVLGAILGAPSKAYVPAMIEGLRVRDVRIRAMLVNTLASVGDSPDILPAIYKNYPEQRQTVIEAASRNGKIPTVLQLGLKDPDPAIRRMAAAHIKEADPSLRGDIITAALSDPDEDVRLEAVSAASSAGIEGVLIKAASDPSMRVKRASAAGLVRLKSAKAPAILEKLVRDASPEVSEEALRHLIELGEVVPSSLWRALFQDRSVSTEVRVAAAGMLSSRKDPQSIPLFIKALSGDKPKIKEAAIKGMPAFGKDALPAIYALLTDNRLRTTSLTLIKQMGDQTAENPLLSALSRMDDVEFSAALEILVSDGGVKSVDTLIGLYRDASVYRKNSIVKTLGQLKADGDNAALVAVISDALDSGIDSIRFHAAHAAGSLKLKGLDAKLRERVEKEQSDLIRNEFRAAISAIEGKD